MVTQACQEKKLKPTMTSKMSSKLMMKSYSGVQSKVHASLFASVEEGEHQAGSEGRAGAHGQGTHDIDPQNKYACRDCTQTNVAKCFVPTLTTPAQTI